MIMRKKFFAIYALAGALVASPVFTSCVDDSVSESVEALRNANTQYKKAQTAQTEANTAIMQANAALQQEAQRIANELAAAQLAHEKAMNAYEEALKEKQNEKELEELRIALEQALRNEEIAKAKAEAALEAAKLQAEQQLINAQKQHMAAQAEMDKYIAGLEAAKKEEANKINGNVDAIMNGGSYYAFDGYEWNVARTYANNYSAYNDYNSIVALTQGLVNENVNLHGLKNDLVDIEEYIAEEKLNHEETIAEKEALIAKYTELQKTSSREEAEKAYKDAQEKLDDAYAERSEANYAQTNANQALIAHRNSMLINPIQKMVSDIEWANNYGYNIEYQDYLTAKENEVYKDTIALINGNNTVYTRTYEAVYEHTAENAEKLAEKIAGIEEQIEAKNKEIEAKKEEIAEYEANMAKVNATEFQREAAVWKVKLAEAQKAYDDVLASQAYKDKVTALEKAVADAQAAFNAKPTDFPAYQDENADGTPKYDANGDPVIVKSTRELLEDAEAALADVVENKNYNYGTEAEPKWLSDLYNTLYTDLVSTNAYGPREYTYWDIYLQEEVTYIQNGYYNAHGLIALGEMFDKGLEYLEADAENWLETLNDQLEGFNAEIEDYNESIEEYKELQAMLAPTSDEMKEYVALCEKRAELQKAYFECNIQYNVILAKTDYYDNLKNTLDIFVNHQWQGIYNYAELIEAAEEAIKEAKEAIAELEYNGNGKLNKEAAIAKKEAEIAAIEAELKIRQAEFEAELAELKALVDVEEEEVPAE